MIPFDGERAKKELRQQCRHQRKSMSQDQRQREQERIDQALQLLLGVDPRRPFAAYAAMADECSCDALCHDLWRSGRSVYLPKVIGPRLLSWHMVSSRSELKAGYRGIREPCSAAAVLPSDCIIIVPGLAFSAQGQRLGMGGGYYDAVLAGLSDTALSIGLAWSCQLRSEIPMDVHDQSVMQLISGGDDEPRTAH